MTHAKFNSNKLMLTLIYGIRASGPPGPGERLKRPGLIGLKYYLFQVKSCQCRFLLNFYCELHTAQVKLTLIIQSLLFSRIQKFASAVLF